ncbi:sulfurtransferase [Mycolicibacterium sp. (ex Dasyatis americana)]|nr:sulfurtransferase [Mycolicibacterium sp. (ex Dasyatis americana)]
MFTRMRDAALTAIVSTSLASCAASTGPPAAAPTGSGVVDVADHRLVGVDEFATTIGKSETLTINVHVPYQGDIPGTDLSIPFDRIVEQSDRLPTDRDAMIAIYCRTGPMSATAATTLKSLGYTDVVELDGGMKAWQASGRPLVGN